MQPVTPDYSTIREDARRFYTQGIQSAKEKQWVEALQQFQDAAAKLETLPKTQLTDDDYRDLGKYHNNIAVSYESIGKDDFDATMIKLAMTSYEKCAKARELIVQKTVEDEIKLAHANGMIFEMSEIYFVMSGPFSDDFDKYCRNNIDALEAAKNNKFDDQDYRCLARWHFALSQSPIELDVIAQLKTAIELQNKIIKRQPEDELELANSCYDLSESYQNEGKQAEATKACEQGIAALKRCTLEEAGKFLKKSEDLLKEIGRECSVVVNNSIWQRLPREATPKPTVAQDEPAVTPGLKR